MSDVEGGQPVADLGHAGVQRREHDAGEDLLVRAVDGDGGEAGRHQLERSARRDVVAAGAELARDLGALGRVAVGPGGRAGQHQRDGKAETKHDKPHATPLFRHGQDPSTRTKSHVPPSRTDRCQSVRRRPGRITVAARPWIR